MKPWLMPWNNIPVTQTWHKSEKEIKVLLDDELRPTICVLVYFLTHCEDKRGLEKFSESRVGYIVSFKF